MSDSEIAGNPFTHLKQRAIERAHRTVGRTPQGLAALQAANQNLTAESLKQVTRELEPSFAGLSFQVIRRNPRASALYREAAGAFTAQSTPQSKPRTRRRRRGNPPPELLGPHTTRCSASINGSWLRGFALEPERQRRATLAYDQRTLLAKLLHLEEEIILLQTETSRRS